MPFSRKLLIIGTILIFLSMFAPFYDSKTNGLFALDIAMQNIFGFFNNLNLFLQYPSELIRYSNQVNYVYHLSFLLSFGCTLLVNLEIYTSHPFPKTKLTYRILSLIAAINIVFTAIIWTQGSVRGYNLFIGVIAYIAGLIFAMLAWALVILGKTDGQNF